MNVEFDFDPGTFELTIAITEFEPAWLDVEMGYVGFEDLEDYSGGQAGGPPITSWADTVKLKDYPSLGTGTFDFHTYIYSGTGNESLDSYSITFQIYSDATSGQTIDPVMDPFWYEPASPVYLFGSAFGDTITGSDGDDRLLGWQGDDFFKATEGADRIDGGEGNDTVWFADATSGVTASLADQSLNTGLADGDTYVSIENLSGSAFGDILYGDSNDNILNGRQGADHMEGGAGNDTYYVDNVGDTIVETGGYGTDSVFTQISYSLKSGQSIETLSAYNPTGSTANLKLGGNSYANTIIGNAGDNFINGGLGADTLTGLAGKDTFMFNTALGSPNVDTITDFNVADDTIRLENGIFTALSGTGTLTAAQFVKNATGLAEDANDRIIYETDTGKLFYDANGSASGGRIHFATLDKNLALTASDFFIV